MRLFIIFIVALGALVGISIMAERVAHPDKYEEQKQLAQQAEQAPAPPPSNEPLKATLKPGNVATVKTNKGTFKFVLFEEDMPITCKNFIELANSGFYKGRKYHRVEGWVVQGGDPKGDGTGGSEKTIPLELKKGLGYEIAYMVGMARTQDPNSASCQYFVTKEPAPNIQGPETGGYACFGLVFEGQDVITKIVPNDVMNSVTIAPATENDKQEFTKAIKKLADEYEAMNTIKPLEDPNNPHPHSN